ncbi:MAG TPA: GntR family transcriptional regulator [Candidatus Enterocloster faecavium]|uniref:GntR family transcriptional regulator n=1 Tax=Candidatus Enterocloster faecavium TaxID=2838560 RepID=A0A9D2L8U0_9FIRM|nr:GntR family transcriptional regulator [Candidatus Enterocloster faecavium]
MSDITRDTAVPLYLQIASDIKGKIDRKELKANSRIPTEAELSKAYQVSRITIRKALEILVNEEILVRRQRIGTFVSGKKLSRNLNHFMGFTKICELNGKKAGTKFLSAELVRAMPSDVRRLKIPEDDKVIRIRRLRYCDDVPVILEENHFPKAYAYLLAEDLSGSLNEILNQHGVTLVGGSKVIGVCYASREEARLLNIKENDALLLSKDVVHDAGGNSVYWGKEVINVERYEYKILINDTVESE